MRTEREKLQAILSGLERSCRRGRYAYGVQWTNLEELAIELRSAAPTQHYIDLLGIGMAMCEGAALAGEQAEERDTGALSGQGVPRNPRFPTVAEPVARSRVVNRGQADFGEGFRHETPSLEAAASFDRPT